MCASSARRTAPPGGWSSPTCPASTSASCPMTAEKLVERIRARGGRLFCLPSRMVFCLTTDETLRDGLAELGGRFHSTSAGQGGPGGCDRGGKLEWDIWCHMIPVDGEETLYEAIRRLNLAVQEPGGSSSAPGPVEE